MSNTWDKTHSVQSVGWKFNRNGKLIVILDTSIQPYYIYPSQFSERLEVSNNIMTVTIMDLRKEDGGMFYSELTYKDGETDTFTYNVTIYEPVPAPAIRTEWQNVTGGLCNMSLHCSVPSNTSVLSYTWKYRHRDTEYQLYNDTGNLIQMSLQSESWDMEFLCIVHNPADQKNVSVRVQEECPLSAKAYNRNHIILIIIISCLLIILILAVLMRIIILRMKRGKECLNPSEKIHGESQYIEVTSSRGNMNNETLYYNEGVAPPQSTKAETIYTTLQHPRPK
ncbi:SLAM family member 5-like isoform X2 [Mixophyes fleayi]